MASPTRLMNLGMPSGQANALGIDPMTGTGTLTATGSTYAGALVLNGNFAVFGTVASGTGAVLPFAEAQAPYILYNGGSNALTLYPQATEFINAGTAGASFSVTAGKSCILTPGKNQGVSPSVGAWIANLSA